MAENKKAEKNTSAFKTMISILIGLLVISLVFIFGINTYVCISANSDMYEIDEFNISGSDCIMVLGCGVSGSEPSPMLKDRLDTAIELYNRGVAPKILMSGDHGGKYYNEVGVMKLYAIKNGVPSGDIFMDHAGFSTYESLYRAKNIFGCDKIIAVTQKYHLYRTVYLAKSLDIDVSGVSTKSYNYGGKFNREIREILARDKDFLASIFKSEPTVLSGEKINILGDGDITNDESFFALLEKSDIKIN